MTDASQVLSGAAPLIRIVDDDDDLRDALLYILESEGWEAAAYPDARSFLTSDMPSRGGALVLDVQMPGMNGLELFSELASRGYEQPVIFLTAHGDIDMAVDTLRSGAFHFLQKPVESAKFLAAVTAAVEKDRRRREGLPDAKAVQALFDSLTAREGEIIGHIADGLLNAQIAKRLGLSVRTIEAHRASAYRKLGVKSASEVQRLAAIAKGA